MLNNNDLEFIHCEPDEFRVLIPPRRADLLKTIELWLSVPELNENESTIEDYTSLTSQQISDRMRVIDWPNGYRACQIGHLKILGFLRNYRKHWRAIKLSNEKRNVRLNMGMEEIRNRLEGYLKHLFHCYIYAEKQTSTDTYLFSLSITEKNKDPHVLSNLMFGFMVYYPETNLILAPSLFWIKSYANYFKEALLEAFGASSFAYKAVHIDSLKDVKALEIFKDTETVFRDIQNNELDTNPLDIRQKRQKTADGNDFGPDGKKRQKDMDEASVRPDEQKKRIVPIDVEDLADRIDSIKSGLGWSTMSGHRSLHLHLKLPFEPDVNLEEHNYADDVIAISVDMEGMNVAEGIRDLIRHGSMQLPAPAWLEGVGLSGAKNLTVTSEGVFTEEDNHEEPIFKHNPMF